MSAYLTPIQQKQIYLKIKSLFSDWVYFDAVVGQQLWRTILDCRTVDSTTSKKTIEKYYCFKSSEIAHPLDRLDFHLVCDFIKLIFRCTFVEIQTYLSGQRIQSEEISYPEYPCFSQVDDTELNMLCRFRFYLNIGFVVHPPSRKQAHLDMAGRMSGCKRSVVGGKSPSPQALRRIICYEKESGVLPKPRPDQAYKERCRSEGEVLKYRNAQIAKSGLPPPDPELHEQHPATRINITEAFLVLLIKILPRFAQLPVPVTASSGVNSDTTPTTSTFRDSSSNFTPLINRELSCNPTDYYSKPTESIMECATQTSELGGQWTRRSAALAVRESEEVSDMSEDGTSHPQQHKRCRNKRKQGGECDQLTKRAELVRVQHATGAANEESFDPVEREILNDCATFDDTGDCGETDRSEWSDSCVSSLSGADDYFYLLLDLDFTTAGYA